MASIIRPKINRRQWPRHEKKYLVQIATSLQSGFSPASVSNFSRGGLCFVHSEILDKGAVVMVRLPQDLVGLARDVKGRVKWCVPSGTGGFAIGIQYEEPLRWTRYE
ncbi:MAG: PilZ domain-containing protein [Desulfomicrobium sp.]|nr:PilZ domain-containing protein [Pseudomonadota bacterium]MBV1713650.1 PilZ domain-containing protein [Desulfomicrobium sp.]MBU4572186.1 PilZ domain-containing protein [Pseudomonadota bacterium]MBU4594164.1 PilZ domain-containing protein [Pseudomonadota bacterium]MBV1720885.1 PilZ domain-containing protein [Desulfomicrobium sp.]